MAIDDVYRLTIILRSTAEGPIVANTLTFRQMNAIVFDTPEHDLVEAWKAEAENAYLEQFTNRLTVFNYKVGKAPDFATSYQTDETGLVGHLSGDSMPIRTAGVLSMRTALLSKRGRGRMYLPPANEAGNGSDGHPTSGYIDNMIFLGDAIMGMATSLSILYAHWAWSVWSKTNQSAEDVTAFAARNFWGSQRDRKAY